MLCEIHLNFEYFRTETALEVPLSGVTLHVNIQVVLHLEFLLTKGALHRCRIVKVGVGQGMTIQFALPLELFRTFLVFENALHFG